MKIYQATIIILKQEGRARWLFAVLLVFWMWYDIHFVWPQIYRIFVFPEGDIILSVFAAIFVSIFNFYIELIITVELFLGLKARKAYKQLK
jgi:hypothetical protein